MIFSELEWVIKICNMDSCKTNIYGGFNNTIIITDDTRRIDIINTPYNNSNVNRIIRMYHDKEDLADYLDLDFDEYIGRNKELFNES